MIRSSDNVVVEPGDFAAVRSFGWVSNLIATGEEAAYWITSAERRQKRKEVGKWTHAIFYMGGPHDLILEAEPGGARIRPFRYDTKDCLWSSGRPALALTPAQRLAAPDVARKYEHVGYSFLDYDAIALHALGSDAEFLRLYIAATKHQICSQLTDQCRLDLGSHLYADDRWPGFVDPLDIAIVISESALAQG
jgi:hypothetical protein